MSQPNPPTIDANALPSPSAEWASSTTDAISNSVPPSLQHSVSTPGPLIPGAYPRGVDEQSGPSILEDPSQLKQYLPQAVQSYFDGARPQTIAESEKNQVPQLSPPSVSPLRTDSFNTEQSISSTKAQAGSSDGSRSIDSTPLATPGASIITSADLDSTAAVRSLPMTSETAIIHEEKTPSVESPMIPQADSSTSLFKDPTVGQNQTIVMESPEAMTPSSIQSPIQSLNNTSTNAHTGHSVVTQSSLAASDIETNRTSTNADVGHDSEPLHAEKPLPPVVNLNPSALNGSKFQEKSSPDIQPPAASSKVSNDSKGSGNSSDLASNPASPTKSSFMRKIRGEVKVLSGKLGKNEEKIEEGRRMMGKV